MLSQPMKFVIKFEDGAYNRGMGHPVTLLEADVYTTKEMAELVANDLTDGAQVIPYPETVASTPTVWTSFSERRPTNADLPILLWNAAVPKIKYSASPDALRSQLGLTCFTHWMKAPPPPN